MNQDNEVFAAHYENVDTNTYFTHHIIIQHSQDYGQAWRDALKMAMEYTDESPFLLRGLEYLGMGITTEN